MARPSHRPAPVPKPVRDGAAPPDWWGPDVIERCPETADMFDDRDLFAGFGRPRAGVSPEARSAKGAAA